MASTGHRWSGKRWSADTEIAFLLALKLTGNVAEACRQIGRSHTGANARRRSNPDFAAKCQAVLDEKHWETIAAEKARLAAIITVDAEHGAGAMANEVHYDGWTPVRQRAFLRALATTGQIEKSCGLVGMSTASARKMRKKYPSFDAACERALAKAVPTLEQIAVDRAVNGVREAVWHGGKLVGHRQRYSDGLMREMLKREEERIGTHRTPAELERDAHAAAKAAGGSFIQPPSPIEDVIAAIEKRLAALAARKAEEKEARRVMRVRRQRARLEAGRT